MAVPSVNVAISRFMVVHSPVLLARYHWPPVIGIAWQRAPSAEALPGKVLPIIHERVANPQPDVASDGFEGILRLFATGNRKKNDIS
jgi:hypothetical protein